MKRRVKGQNVDIWVEGGGGGGGGRTFTEQIHHLSSCTFSGIEKVSAATLFGY